MRTLHPQVLHPQHPLATRWRLRTLLQHRRSIRRCCSAGSLHTCAARARRVTSASCAATWWSSTMQARRRRAEVATYYVEGRLLPLEWL